MAKMFKYLSRYSLSSFHFRSGMLQHFGLGLFGHDEFAVNTAMDNIAVELFSNYNRSYFVATPFAFSTE
jgi:hypothetical protein